MNDSPYVMPSWYDCAPVRTVVTNRTCPPPRWIACRACGGAGQLPARVWGYAMMASCTCCGGSGGYSR
jgi:hypothetical protein